MSKPTPGPWEVEGHESDDNLKVAFYEGDRKVLICDVDHQFLHEGRGEANAHLIAAAPELLEVCKKMLDHLDGCSHGYPDDLWDQAEAAIAKAEGGDL